MASIKYLIQSKKEIVQIYIRLSIGRGKNYKRRVGLTIESKSWSIEKGMPKQTSASNKKIASNLRGLSKFIFDELNNASINNIETSGDWLTTQIDIYFDRVEYEETDYLINYAKKFLESLKTVGRAENTIIKYKTAINLIIKFELKFNKRFLIKDVNLDFGIKFIAFLKDDCKYQDNTASRSIRYIKTICFDAESNGFVVSPQLRRIKNLPTQKIPFVYLTLEEIEKIKNTNFVDPQNQVTADWLIISCFTGQRVSDLLRMNRDMILKEQGFNFISITQIKTGKQVQIPFGENIKEILNKRNGEFPPLYGYTEKGNAIHYNILLKKVCKKAGLVEVVDGNLYNEETERREVRKYPKYQLISSHVGRRSYASNFFGKIPTPLLMNITGHSSESMFMKYIHKTSSDMSIELARILEKSII